MDGATFWMFATLSAFCVGLAKGGAPAFGVLAVPILALSISPVTAAGLLLPVFVFTDIFGVWAYRKYVDWRLLKVAALGIFVGTGVGWATAHLVSDQFVRVLIGVIGFVFSLNFLLRARLVQVSKPMGVPLGLFWTTVAGFTSFVSHAGAPPWQVWVVPQRLPKMLFAGTTIYAFAYMNVLKILPYYLLGQLQAENLQVTLILFIPALVGVFAAWHLLRILSEQAFYTLVIWMLFVVSIKLIWDGVVA